MDGATQRVVCIEGGRRLVGCTLLNANADTSFVCGRQVHLIFISIFSVSRTGPDQKEAIFSFVYKASLLPLRKTDTMAEAAHPPPPTPEPPSLAPRSAQTSLKRARILFDTSTNNNANSSSSDDTLLTSTRAFVALPLFDSQIHKASVSRRIKLFYPGEVANLAYQGEEEEEAFAEGDGGGKSRGISSGSSKESATVRAVKELRREALDRLRSGVDVGAAAGGGGGGDGEGRLVIHREMDLLRRSSAASSAAAAGAGGGASVGNNGALVLAGGGTKAAPGGAGTEGKPIRAGGILVVRQLLFMSYCLDV
jgi:hypothetical protein